MLKKRFDLYVNIILFPIIISGLFYAFFPEKSLSFLCKDFLEPSPADFFVRLFFISQILTGITILSARDNPSKNRSLIFWISIYLLSIGAFFISGIFFFNLKILAVLPGIFLILSGAFLMAYASRYILVRE